MVTRSEVATGALAMTALVDRRNCSVEGRNHDGEQMRQQEEASKRKEKGCERRARCWSAEIGRHIKPLRCKRAVSTTEKGNGI